jgi:hypothetical protein
LHIGESNRAANFGIAEGGLSILLVRFRPHEELGLNTREKSSWDRARLREEAGRAFVSTTVTLLPL